ncbi:polyhydroxyalkanoic acid system family protein [Lysobacter korlensis]|uniref:Polyhydroxyalkanoic acid system family protein n=1 Tax=Lysobacter korlensis TaxID=553636 RepID=A0ABV6RL74_9GAMM
MPPPQARHAVQEVAEMLAQRFGVEYGWDGDVLNFNRAGIDGHIALLPQELHVRAQLGFMLSMMKGSIESEIRRVLSERFH